MQVVDSFAPTVITPKPHQWETMAFELEHKICYNLSACGSGKTLPSVLALKALWDGGALTRILVVCPIQVVEATWMAHIEQFAPGVPVLALHDGGTRRRLIKERLKGFKGIVLMNPDGVKCVFHDLRDWFPEIIVIDELAGYYRNCRTDRWKAIAALKYFCKPAVWAFTGTPLANNLMDFYAQCLLVNPDMLPKSRTGKVASYKQMRDMLMTQPYMNVWRPKPGALERVMSYMQPAIRFSREQVMSDILTPILLRKNVPLTTEQTKLLKELRGAGTAQFGRATIKGKDLMTLMTKATQIAMGVVYDSQGNEVIVPSGPRVQALVDVFEEVEQTPVIVTAYYVPVINALAEQLRLKKYRTAVIYGEVKPAERAAIIKDFQSGKYDFLVCQPRTLAHGVTLTRSSTVVWYGPIHDHEMYAQLCDRIFRYGQEGQPLVIEFSSTPIENKMYQSLRGKEAMSGSYLDLF